MKKTLNFCRQQMRHLDPLFPNFGKILLLILVMIGSVGIELHGQPTKKGVLSFPTTQGPSESED